MEACTGYVSSFYTPVSQHLDDPVAAFMSQEKAGRQPGKLGIIDMVLFRNHLDVVHAHLLAASASHLKRQDINSSIKCRTWLDKQRDARDLLIKQHDIDWRPKYS